MKQYFTLICCLFVTGTYSNKAIAQQPADSIRVVTLDSAVVVTDRVATRLGEANRSVTVLSGDELQNAPIYSVADVLKYVPGVDLRQRGVAGVQADASLLGGTYAQTLILIDGVKVNDPQTGHHNLELPLSPSDIERVEVLNGAAATVYGQNAFAGAINIVTRKNSVKKLSVSGLYGEKGLFQTGASLSLPVGHYSQTLSGSFNSAGSYMHNTDFHIQNLLYRGHLEGRKVDFTLLAGHNHKNFGAQNFYAATVLGSHEYENTETTFISLGAEVKGTFHLRPEVYYRRHYDDYELHREMPDLARNKTTGQVLGASLSGQFQSLLGVTALGAELRQDWITSTNLGDHQRSNAGFYLQQKFSIGSLAVVPAVNISWFTGYGWNAYPGLDLGLRLTDHWRATANVGRSFRVPTFTELYYTLGGTIGNPNLAPESAWNYQAGIRYTDRGVQADAGVFRRQGLSQIDYAQPLMDPKVPPTPPPFTARNVNNVTTDGITLNARVNMGTHFFLEELRVGYTALTQQKSQVDYTTRYLFQFLRQQVITDVRLKLVDQLRASLVFRYTFRANTGANAALDARVFYSQVRWTAFVQGTNLFNKPYYDIPGLQLPGRWLSIGFTLNVF